MMEFTIIPIGFFEFARETGSRALLNCIVGLFWGMHFHHCVRRARPQVARKRYTTRSGDVIWGTGKYNFNAVSHNRARP